MWRWSRWAARTVATALLVSFLSIWTTGYIVNSYMQTLLKQLDLPLETQPFALSGVWGKLWGAGAAPDATPDASPDAAKTADAGEKDTPQPSASAVTHTPEPATPSRQAAPGSPAPSDDTSIPVFGGNAGILDMTEQQREALYTVMSKLNGTQLAELTQLLENGLTQEEQMQVGDLIRPSLSEEEYGQMMELLKTRTETAEPPADQP